MRYRVLAHVELAAVYPPGTAFPPTERVRREVVPLDSGAVFETDFTTALAEGEAYVPAEAGDLGGHVDARRIEPVGARG